MDHVEGYAVAVVLATSGSNLVQYILKAVVRK